MTRFVLVSMAFAALVLSAVVALTPSQGAAMTFYADKIRVSLFTGLLTVGSFLLSLKVFIVVKFKENVFDSPAYLELLNERRKIKPSLKHYAPVRQLSTVLFVAISSALIASVSQVTIGLIAHPAAFLICIALAAFAGAMLFQTLILIRVILTEWLDYMEK
ncbi:hypothetical protein [Roseateles sp.]|uniref:hypothetical protein n=1 Tax=Roseateles sp. TaxID=1971397 RepID=UPI0031D5B46A